MDKQIKDIEKITKDLFSYIGVQVDFQIKKEAELVVIRLNSDEPGVLIGYHGQALNALQQMITLMAFKKFGQWVRILVDVEDYREKRKEILEKMAQSAAQKVKLSGQSEIFPPMSSFERRIIHLAIAAHPEVETISEGEGNQRHIVIKSKS
ncbi:KH domain-containing protein [Patescibacteria group bacterium]|nr:KH domain-containing protein [Patescibacteria group bacterium]